MSYLSEVLRRKITAKEGLAKSVTYLAQRLGLHVDDAAVDKAVQATDAFTDSVEALVDTYIKDHLPALPAAVVQSAVTSLMSTIDAAVAGAANVVKDNN